MTLLPSQGGEFGFDPRWRYQAFKINNIQRRNVGIEFRLSAIRAEPCRIMEMLREPVMYPIRGWRRNGVRSPAAQRPIKFSYTAAADRILKVSKRLRLGDDWRGCEPFQYLLASNVEKENIFESGSLN